MVLPIPRRIPLECAEDDVAELLVKWAGLVLEGVEIRAYAAVRTRERFRGGHQCQSMARAPVRLAGRRAPSSIDLPAEDGELWRAVRQLPRRKAQVVALVADGLTNRDVASELGLSEHTVKKYLFRIFDKLGISNRVELVLYAVHHGLPQTALAATA